MNVSDGDRYAVAMAKLSQARNAVYEATKIIEHLFESDGQGPECMAVSSPVDGCVLDHDPDPVTGLYPGQTEEQPDFTEEEAEGAECID